jgi:hypothetical protein
MPRWAATCAANDVRLKALERRTYRAMAFDAESGYYGSDYQHNGENNGYRIDPGHFLANESSLQKPLELTTNSLIGARRLFRNPAAPCVRGE